MIVKFGKILIIMMLFNYPQLKKFSNFCLPHSCLLCHAYCNREIDLCIECEAELPFIKNACQRCGRQTTHGITVCGSCLQHDLPFDHTFSLFHYETPITQLITDLKFHGVLMNGKVLGQLMSNYLLKHYVNRTLPECIVPIPLHTKRLKERGYNQAIELARPIAKQLSISINRHLCKRIKNTNAQSLLSAKERKKNIKNAFVINKDLNIKHIAILDDVITTGSTITEISKTFKKAGVKIIDVWSCARA